MSSNKLMKRTRIDRLSELPDSIIIQILSLLDMKHSSTTAVLSKRWRSLWRQSPNLLFTEYSTEADKVQALVTRVHRTLLTTFRSRSSWEIFSLEFPYTESLRADIDIWVDFAVQCKVKQVSLLLQHSPPPVSLLLQHSPPPVLFDCYTLPELAFHNPHLTSLTLSGCGLSPRTTVEWRALTVLSISGAEVLQPVVEKILSGCPVLHKLVLLRCWGFNSLVVESKSLSSLYVSDRENKVGENEALLRVSGPHLHTLCVYAVGRKLSIGNVSSLVKAAISFTRYYYVNASDVIDNVKDLLEKTRHAKDVMIFGLYSEVLSLIAKAGYRFPQSARTCLFVRATPSKRTIHGIVGLLESSSNLKDLVIQGTRFVQAPSSHPDPKSDLACDLSHLKTITIKDFVHTNLDGEPLLTLARHLLSKTPALEKMVVSFTEATSERLYKISQTLLSFPRSSKNAVVLLN